MRIRERYYHLHNYMIHSVGRVQTGTTGETIVVLVMFRCVSFGWTIVGDLLWIWRRVGCLNFLGTLSTMKKAMAMESTRMGMKLITGTKTASMITIMSRKSIQLRSNWLKKSKRIECKRNHHSK